MGTGGREFYTAVARARREIERRAGAVRAAARGAPAVGVHLTPSGPRAERPPGLVHRPPEGEHARPRASRGTRIRRASRVRRRVALVGADAGDGHRPDGFAIEPAPSGARLRGVTAGVRARASRVSPRGQTTASEVPAATRREVWPRSPSRNFVSSRGFVLFVKRKCTLVDPDPCATSRQTTQMKSFRKVRRRTRTVTQNTLSR